MIKVCLSLAFLSAFVFSISAQTNQQPSTSLSVESITKKDPNLPVSDKTPSTAETAVVTKINKPEESKTEIPASTDEKTDISPEIKKTQPVSAATTQNAAVLPAKTAKSTTAQTTGNLKIDRYIADACEKYGVDPLLIFAQMKQESSFKRGATSSKGASGLMQLMPDTAKRFGIKNIYNPKQNIDAGVKYMRWLLDKFGGDVKLALAGYNAGEGAVMKYGNQIPPFRETQAYVKRITDHYAEISSLLAAPVALTESPDQHIVRSF